MGVNVNVTVNVRVNEFTPPLAVPPSSTTTTVINADPLALAIGVKVKLPVALGLV